MESLENFRDIGGIKTIDGRTVIEKQFLRSAEFANLSKSDISELLNVFDLKWDIDFRSALEVKQVPDEVIEGVTYEHLDVVGAKNDQAAAVQANMTNPDVKLDGKKIMIEGYEEMVSSESGRKAYSEFLTGFLTHPNETTLFHCTGGKDRTGIGAALILSSLNVSQELILEDYLKTNEGLKNSDKVSMEQYKKAGLSAEKIDQLEEMSKADPTYLEAAFNKIKSEYGNLDNYFTKGLGLPADFKEQMMKLYTILA